MSGTPTYAESLLEPKTYLDLVAEYLPEGFEYLDDERVANYIEMLNQKLLVTADFLETGTSFLENPDSWKDNCGYGYGVLLKEFRPESEDINVGRLFYFDDESKGCGIYGFNVWIPGDEVDFCFIYQNGKSYISSSKHEPKSNDRLVAARREWFTWNPILEDVGPNPSSNWVNGKTGEAITSLPFLDTKQDQGQQPTPPQIAVSMLSIFHEKVFGTKPILQV